MRDIVDVHVGPRHGIKSTARAAAPSNVSVLRDLRYACRGLTRSPVFTIVALLSIAVGIGANTAIFTLVDEVLLRFLPVKDPEQLVLFDGPRHHYGGNQGATATSFPLSFPMYEDFRDGFVDRGGAPALPRVSQAVASTTTPAAIFSGMFARRAVAMNVGVGGQTERVPGELVSGTYFPVLGVAPAVGRLIGPGDDRVRGGEPVAVLSYDYWRNRFGSDPHIVGQTIAINNLPFTIIGVSQNGFHGVDIGNAPSVCVPIMMKAQITPSSDLLGDRRQRWVNVFGRMKPGVTIEQAQAALQPFFHAIIEEEARQPAFNNATAYTRAQFLTGRIGLLPAAQGRSPLRQQLAQPLWLLFGIVAGVLLIACANVASLLIARATSRQKEIAVRLALGASRGRIVGQLLVESVLLVAIGGLLGLAVSWWTTRFLLAFLPTSETPHVIAGAIDRRVLAFTCVLSLATGVLFGLAPALRSTRPSLAPTLKDQVGAVAGGAAGVRFRKALVVAQVTISVLLLVGAGLFVRTLRNLRLVDLGLNTEHLIAFNLNPGLSGYTSERTKELYKRLVERLRGEAGVQSAAFASMGVLEGNEWDSSVVIEGYQAKADENVDPHCNSISPGYFQTMGIPVVLGRDFDARDEGVGSPAPGSGNGYRAVIANERFVNRFFGDRNPIGRHLGFGLNPETPTPIEIVGVVKDSKYEGVRDEIPMTLFFPLLEERAASSIAMYVRSSGDPAAAFAASQRAVRDLDAKIPIYNLRTLDRQIERSLVVERFIATLSTAFGVLATLLAVIGLYGVMAYTVARRTREIGVRLALGALRRDVVWLVMREVIVLVGAGVSLGLGAAFGLSRAVGSQLYGITPADPLTLASAAAALGIVALVAGYIPARRATRISPMRALRYE
jgi:putative ABC transport system permease protein